MKEEYGRGGLGRILLAEDRQLGRIVALKVLLRKTPEALARFLREAHYTARLQHPGIVPVHDVGIDATGEPFYAMKLVKGRPLRELIAQTSTLDERLALVPILKQVADAIAYAHSEGILHRDLKPANIIVGDFGEAIVIDWGLAKDTRDDRPSPRDMVGPLHQVPAPEATTAGAVLGTPAYMPPEQARGEAVDERADVYALGAILYHVITGVPPFASDHPQLLLAEVRVRSPRPVRELAPAAPPDLAAIVARAMQWDRNARYADAASLAADLGAFVQGQRVAAHVYSVTELLHRWRRRYRLPLGVAAAALCALIALGALSVQRIVHERDQAALAQRDAEHQRTQAQAERNRLILTTARNYLDTDPTTSIAWLKTYPLDGDDWDQVADIAATAQGAGIARWVLRGPGGLVMEAQFTPEGDHVVAGANDGSLWVWDLRTGHGRALARDLARPPTLRLAPGGWITRTGQGGLLWRHNLHTGAARAYRGHAGELIGLAVPADGSFALTTAQDGTLRHWDFTTGTSTIVDRPGEIGTIWLSPDGRRLATCSHGRLRLWTIPGYRRRDLAPCTTHHPYVLVSFSPDGRRLATVGRSEAIEVREATTGRLVARMLGHAVPPWDYVFSPDGALLASSSGDKTTRIWNADTGKLATALQHDAPAARAEFSPDGHLLAAHDTNGATRVLSVASGGQVTLRAGRGVVGGTVHFARDAQHIVVADPVHRVRVWPRPALLGSSRHSTAASVRTSYSPDGRRVAIDNNSPDVFLWSAQDKSWRRLTGHSDSVTGVGFVDDLHLFSHSDDGTVRRWDVSAGQWQIVGRHPTQPTALVVSPSRKLVASGNTSGEVLVFAAAGQQVATVAGHRARINEIAFFPDEQRFATASSDGTLRVWHLTGATPTILRGHDGPVFTLAPLSAGMLASGGQDGSVRIWDTATGRSTVLDRHDQRVGKVRASPDGHLLASTSMDGTMRVRNLRENRYQSRFAHDATFVSLRFSPDGSMLAYGDNRGRFCISNLHIARLICVPGHAGYVADLLFSPTQHELASNNGELRLWDTETMREQSVPLAPAPLSVWLQNRTNLAPQHIMKERGKQ